MPKKTKTPTKPNPSSQEQQNLQIARQAILDAMDSQVGKITDVGKKSFTSKVDEAMSSVGYSIMRKVPNPVRFLLLPSRNKSFQEEVGYRHEDYQHLLTQEGQFSEVAVERKGKKIATYQVDRSPTGTPAKDKKYIINFNGNGTYALQTHPEMLRDAQHHECVVIGFDYPGVGESAGKTKVPRDMVNAGYQQVRRLIEMGVPPENILLKGQSIGGGIATLVAAKCHEEGDKVYLFNQRSFSKMSTTVKAMLGGGVLGSIGAGVVKSLGWGINALSAWKKIPDSHKDFCFAADDKVIQEPASLAKGIGREADESRKLQCGHNESLYCQQSPWDSPVKTAEGKDASDIFDSFAKRAFNQPKVTIGDVERQRYDNSLQGLKKLAVELTERESKAHTEHGSLIWGSKPKYQGELKVIQNLYKEGMNFLKKENMTASDIKKFQSSISKIQRDYKKVMDKKQWPVRSDDPVVALLIDFQKMAKGLEEKVSAPQQIRRATIQ